MPTLRRGATALVLVGAVGAAAWSAQHGGRASVAAGLPPHVRAVRVDAGRTVCFTFTWGEGKLPKDFHRCTPATPSGATQIRLPLPPGGALPMLTTVVVGVDGVVGSGSGARCFTVTAGEHRPVVHACTHRP